MSNKKLLIVFRHHFNFFVLFVNNDRMNNFRNLFFVSVFQEGGLVDVGASSFAGPNEPKEIFARRTRLTSRHAQRRGN